MARFFLFFVFSVCLWITTSAEHISVGMNPLPEEIQGVTWSTYTIEVEIGFPSQSINLIVDGGLDLFYTFTPNCTEAGCGTAYFFPKESETLSLAHEFYLHNYTYAAGNLIISGPIGIDQITIGSGEDINQALALITNYSQPFYFPPSNEFISGVFGFAYPSPEYNALSIIPQFIKQNSLKGCVSIWLPNSIYEGGILSFGDPVPSLFTGTISYMPLLSSGFANKDYPFFWSNVISDIKVNGVSNGYCSRRTCNFFIDLASRPMDLAGAIPAIHVDANCGNIDSLDTYTFVIGGMEYTMTPSDYIIEYRSKNGTLQCESGIFGGSHIPYPFTLGYTWIKNFYTVLDYENKQFGFAPSAKTLK